jgi:hypothetical protein
MKRWLLLVLVANTARSEPSPIAKAGAAQDQRGALAIPAAWAALDPRVHALLPRGAVLQLAERTRWGTIMEREYDVQVAPAKLQAEVDRLVDIARASELPPTFEPYGIAWMRGPGLDIHMKETPSSNTLDVKFTFDSVRVGTLDEELARLPPCSELAQLARLGRAKSLDYVRAVDDAPRETLAIRLDKQGAATVTRWLQQAGFARSATWDKTTSAGKLRVTVGPDVATATLGP